MCVKRKTKRNNCHRPAIRLERVEEGIAEFYTRFTIPPARAEQIREAVREELASQQDEAVRGMKQAHKRKQHAQDERQKLLRAHYAGAVPQDLLASEMKRLTRELAEADTEITAAKATNRDVEATLAAALQAASSCQQAYLTAPGPIRKQINQGFFKRLFIGEDGTVERAELTEPFAALLDVRLVEASPEREGATDTDNAAQTDGDATDGHRPENILLTGVSGRHGRVSKRREGRAKRNPVQRDDLL